MKRRLFNAGAVVARVLCLIPTRFINSALWIVMGIPVSAVVAWMTWCIFVIGFGNGFEIDREPTASESFALKVGNTGAPLLFMAGATGCVVFSWRAAQRQKPGVCASCGYDLRGTPGSVCPECGEAAREAGREA